MSTGKYAMVTADLDSLGLRPGNRILDVGCGSGRHLAALYRYPAVTVVGVDFSCEDLTEAQKRLELHDRLGEHGGGRWRLLTGDIRNLPFPDGAFDFVICSEVLEHVPDHHTAAGDVLRVLKPGGQLVVSVPRNMPERICWRLSRAYRTAEGGHVRIYRREELVDLFERLAARLTRTHYAHGLHTPFWWLKCLVGPDRTDVAAVNLFHRFLTWDLMKKPPFTRRLERLLNPLIGKSTVFYFTKI